MGSAMFLGMRGDGGGTMEFPVGNGRMNVSHFHILERQLLPTDPQGTITLTLSGIKPGSEVAIFGAGGVPLANVPSSDATASFVLQRYSAGSPNNNVRIMVLSLNYEVFDFDYVLGAKDITIPVFQRIDRSYRNPA